MTDRYRREVESLHDFFVAWFTGQADAAAFDQFEDALCPSFEIVSPDGAHSARDDILSAVRDSYGSHAVGEFDIEIRNVEPIAEYDDVALVRYEEWQETPDWTTGRLSTVAFEPTDSDGGSLGWRHVQETWLEEPES